MQTDIWLTEDTDYSERCPQCSQPLKNGSITCFSCGFSTKSLTGMAVWIDPAVYRFSISSSQRQSRQFHHVSQETRRRYARELPQARRHPNPNTPIPPLAAAQSSNATPGSILPTLSLSISEEPTQPELEAQGRVTRRLPRIDEIITVPPRNVDHSFATSMSLVPVISQHNVTPFRKPDQTSTHILLSQEIDAISWTAGKASESPYARLISSRDRFKRPHIGVSLNPIDRLRWWLLRPGHIEFILWLGGTVLLVAVSCVLLFVTAFSFEWITPGFISPASTKTFGTPTISGQRSTVVATSKMVLIRMDKGPVLLGQPIQLRGEGFSPYGHIRFMFDGTLQLFDQNGQSTSTQANTYGIFTTSLVLDNHLPWNPGPHSISAQDLTTKHIATLQIILSPAPIGKSMPNTPVPLYPPNATPPAVTPIPSVTKGQPIPVGQTPVPITPTPHPVTPTPTSTVGTIPIVTPTLGTSPIVGTTPGVTTARVGTSVSSGLGNALDNTWGTYLSKQLAHFSPLVWLMIAFYCLSMVLLGLAGVLHKRHR
jgi:hypothetical protein